MKKMVFLLSTAIVIVSAACMTPPPGARDHMVSDPQIIQEESEQLQALLDAGKSFSRVVTVPAANNMLSNGVFIGVLMMGSGSTPADSLLDILREGKEQAVAVVGKSNALTTATIKAAIRQFGGKPTATTLLFAGESSSVEELQKLAEKAGVPFDGIAFPQPQVIQVIDSSPQGQNPPPQEKDPPPQKEEEQKKDLP